MHKAERYYYERNSITYVQPLASLNPLPNCFPHSHQSKMAALRKLFSPSIFTPIASPIPSLCKKKMPKDDRDPPPTPNAVEIPLQPLIGSSNTDDVIHGDVVVDVEAPPPNIASTSQSPSSQLGLKSRSPQLIPTSTPTLPSASTPTMNIDSSSKHIRKMVPTVAILLMTFASLLIVNQQDISLMSDSLAKSMAYVSNVVLLVTFCFGACLILHCLMCVHPSDHLNDIWVQKHIMQIGVVFMVLSLLFRTLVIPSSTRSLLVLVSWLLALLIVFLVFTFVRMVSYLKFSTGMAAPDLAAGGMDNRLPV